MPIIKVIGIDIGETRVGVALGSMETKYASPLITLLNNDNLFSNLEKIIKENEVGLIVAGLPRNLDNEETMQTKYSRKVADEIKNKLSIEVVFQDEALTSVKAKDELDARKKPYEKGDIDKLAACYILEDYLIGSS